MYLNLFVCAGNLTDDPVLHFTGKGTPWCSGGVALNKPIPPGDRSSEWRSETHYVDWTAWGKLAQRCADRLRKGDPVILQGELRYEQWDDKDTGKKRTKLRLVVTNVQRLPRGKKKDEAADATAPEPEPPEDLGAPGDDVPF